MTRKYAGQSEISIGTLGHVDHGKTTLVSYLTGEWTDRHSDEIRRGISIRLGYAATTLLKCNSCPEPEAFTTSHLAKEGKCSKCGEELEVLREISFVDSPGHESLMATCLSGASLMDGAILVIAANEPCPMPQTSEHLHALEIVGVKNIIIVQNKIELVSKERAKKHFQQIKNFVKGTSAENAPIVPVSAIFGANTDLLIQMIESVIPTPKRDGDAPPKMFVARSFDINRPGTLPMNMRGGVVGGSIVQGKLSVGDEIEIAPGAKGEKGFKPIKAKVVSLLSGSGNSLQEAYPGGLIGVGTALDPAFTRADRLVGNVVGKVGKMPKIYDKLMLTPILMQRVVGIDSKKEVENLKLNEPMMLVIGTAPTVGIITRLHGDEIELTLKRPIAAEKGQRVAIGRRVENKWRLIGYAEI
ncbi:MAG: translation initiation factor IF-2 subunit gamma [Candidatus Thorarchaeota archaeon SMTZ-45]|nr:MAG: translation initiation factor IF-2 subunit gamma [Candidatus Thorarchaeota archaeon SMTZ-45]KXH74253.1 MAG: translation initiation factor IF-2 subunit gamma [Candidatus Thorarchaeota archaeon SMTZ1-45]